MTKDSRGQSASADHVRSSRKLSCNSNRVKRAASKAPTIEEDNVKEWEEARCPVCMEHPHNAVLLICSSHEKGCRPYMCDTSYRHSNCLDQFRKSYAPSVKTEEASSQVDHGSPEAIPELTVTDVVEEGSPNTSIPSPSNNKALAKLLCPLCRGHIKDWVVMDTARRFMNAKLRSCACETCEYSGSYADLRKHARVEHPLARPSEADPERRRNWRRMERQRDMGDLLSTLQSSLREDSDEEGEGTNGAPPAGDRGWLRAFLVLIRVFRPVSGSRSNRSWSGTTTYSYRTRAQVTIRRRSVMLWGEGFDGDAFGSAAIEGGSEPSNDGTAAPP